jgi:hypothetical protein
MAFHKKHPNKDGQRQRGNHRITAVKRILDLGIDEIDHDFAKIL